MGVGKNGNLIPPVKGEIRNPHGRPKGSKESPRAQLRRMLRRMAPEDAIAKMKKAGLLSTKKEKATFAALLGARLLGDAVKGEAWAMKLIFEQVEAPLPREVKLEGDLNVTGDAGKDVAALMAKLAGVGEDDDAANDK